MSLFNVLLGGTQGLGQGIAQRQKFQADEADKSYLNEERQSQSLARVASAQAADKRLKTIQEHWAKAVAGDTNSQAAIVAVDPALGARFEAPDKPQAPHTITGSDGKVYQFDEPTKAWKLASDVGGVPIAGKEPPPSTIPGTPEWKAAEQYKAGLLRPKMANFVAPDNSVHFVSEDEGAKQGWTKQAGGGGGGASAAVALRAKSALPQIQDAATNLAKYNNPGALALLLHGRPMSGFFTTPEGQNALQAAQELARVHLSIPTGRAPGQSNIDAFARSLLTGVGEEGNPTAIKQHARQVQQMAKQDSVLAGAKGGGSSTDMGGDDPEFDALIASLTPKKKP